MYIHIIGIDQNVRYMIRNYKNVLILFILSFHIIPDGGFGFLSDFQSSSKSDIEVITDDLGVPHDLVSLMV